MIGFARLKATLSVAFNVSTKAPSASGSDAVSPWTVMNSGPFVPGPKPFGEHVVRPADRLVLRVVAGVAEAETDREQRNGEQQQESDGDQRHSSPADAG